MWRGNKQDGFPMALKLPRVGGWLLCPSATSLIANKESKPTFYFLKSAAKSERVSSSLAFIICFSQALLCSAEFGDWFTFISWQQSAGFPAAQQRRKPAASWLLNWRPDFHGGPRVSYALCGSLGRSQNHKIAPMVQGVLARSWEFMAQGVNTTHFKFLGLCRHWYCINERLGCCGWENKAEIQRFVEVYSLTTD